MALGGGTWTAQNKGLPGTYINFSSAARANASLTAGGVVAVPLTLSWGPENTVLTLKAGTVSQTCRSLFGYNYSADEMRALRELFCNAETVLCYRLGTGAAKAENDYATAKYAGARGNALKLVISADADSAGFVVETYLDTALVDSQTVANRIALLFNTQYLGAVPNDANGRISLWNDICKIFQGYEKSRAIEGFDTGSVEVLAGEGKDAVRCRVSGLNAIRAMGKLYMDIVIA